ncbi:MAG: hypothetical protein AAB727_00650 [Patescibacteria group bacterium]
MDTARRFFFSLCALVFLSGCSFLPAIALGNTEGLEVHTLNQVTVIYADHETINKKYRELWPLADPEKDVRGFAIPPLNIIYCTKEDFIACGHELHHLTHGWFHD